jgi:serine phosphatase RsbU (regulator of sigma subunit)
VQLFGVERLDELLLKHAAEGAAVCVERIRAAVCDFCRQTPSDDQTLIALRCA